MSIQKERSRKDAYKESLMAYLELRPSMNLLWISEVLKECSVTEFDHIVGELRPTHGQYLKWIDIPKIRGKLSD